MRRRVVPLFVVATLAQGCGAAPAPPTATSSLCDAEHLDGCERRLVAASTAGASGEVKALAAAYVSIRAGRDPGDAWAKLASELDASDRGAHPRAVVVADGTPAPAAAVRVVVSAGLPAPAAVTNGDLLLAIAAAAGYEQVVWLRPTSVRQLFPRDPLAPWMAGLRAELRDDAALAHLDHDLAAEDALRASFEAASSSRYVDAARASEKLGALVDTSERHDEVLERWRYGLRLLGAAGLVLDADDGATNVAAPTPPTPSLAVEAPAPNDTPYGAYLRVVMAKDDRAAWGLLGARVLEGIGADRREAIAALFVPPRDCAARRSPPLEDARDLVFADKLKGAFPRDGSAALNLGQLPLREWIDRYQALVGLVERSRTAWSYLPALLAQRGEPAGLSAAGTPLYRRVTDLGLAHLAATKALESAFPARYRAFSQVTLALSPGLNADDQLRQELVTLTQASIADKIAAARDAETLLVGLVAGAAAGFSYPSTLQEAHFRALATATSARLHGDFEQKTGWGTALLYGIEGIYRIVAGAKSDAAFDANQIARALAARGVEHPALASLATSAARYASLAAEGKLDAMPAAGDRMSAERRAARSELQASIAALGAAMEAPSNLLEDVTTLTDGLVAVVFSSLGQSGAKKPAAAGTCAAASAPLPLDAKLRKVLGKLGDTRRRILLHPRFKEGDGLWVRRARLLVTVLSDAMDVALAGDAPLRAGAAKHRPTFEISTADAEKVIEAAFREAEKPAVTDLVGGGYGLFRELIVAQDAVSVARRSSRELRRVAAGLFGLFRGEALEGKGPAMGVALLDALAAMHFDASPGDDLVATLTKYAAGFYALAQPERGDLCLLGTLVAAALAKTRVPSGILEVASKANSRVAWIVRFSDEVHKTGERPDPTVYAADLRKATDDSCQTADPEAAIGVMQAIHDFTGGHRQEARAALDALLERSGPRGLVVPRMVYQYEEHTRTKVFQVTFDLSFASGLLRGGSSFQLGFGFRSPSEPGGSLSANLASTETAKSDEEAAKLYVFGAALAAVYHFVDGDTEHGAAAAARAVAALSSGVKLGTHSVRSDKPAAWGVDAEEMLVIAAELAAEAGEPFLAGDLWTVVRQGFTPALDEKAVAAILTDLPVGVRAIGELTPVVERARRSLKILAAPQPCADHKVDVGGFEEPACGQYPLALSLRIADVLKKLPRLRRGAESARQCGPLRSLDAFLASADKGNYDPDAFTHAVEDLRGAGKVYDAAILLARHKHASHCTPAIVTAARALGRSPLLGPGLRADLLSEAVNCASATGSASVEADIALVDVDTRQLPDPLRNLKLVFSVADIASRTDHWEMLDRLVEQPDFIARWMAIHPNAAVAGLVLDHAVAVIRGRGVALDRTRAARDLLCETFKAPERAELCALIDGLRTPAAGTAADRERAAKETVKRLLASVAAPAPAKTP